MSLIQGLWIFSTLAASLSVIGMLRIYWSLEQSFRIHLRFIAEMRRDLMDLRLRHLGRECNDSRVQGMAEDTEMAE